MAGRLTVVADSTVDGYKGPRKLDLNNQELNSNSSITQERIKQLVAVFERVFNSFLDEFSSRRSFLPLPPRIGNGKSVDLFKLFLSVSDKGGLAAATRKGLWKVVAKESGFKPNLAASVKLIYVDYLHKFSTLLDQVFENKISNGLYISRTSKEFKAEMRYFLCEMRKSCEGEPGGSDCRSRVKLRHLVSETMRRYDEYCRIKELPDADSKKVAGRTERRRAKGLIDKAIGINGSVPKGKSCALERKRKNPNDTKIGTLPERSKWTSHGDDEIRKRILVYRAAVSQKKHMVDPQTHQEMHPCLYNDGAGSGYRLRKRPKVSDGLVSGKKAPKSEVPSRTHPVDLDRKRSADSHIGSKYQAVVPDWTGGGGESSQSDSKWLGTRVWPLDGGGRHNRLLIKRDPIGKGRNDSCGCQEFGSEDCVRFHVSQNAEKLKLELGTAFDKWKFDEMGENVAASWSGLEKILLTKSREEIVSYFYNVVLLRRRAEQNRSTPWDVDSADDC